jgi:hypothetical protein
VTGTVGWAERSTSDLKVKGVGPLGLKALCHHGPQLLVEQENEADLSSPCPLSGLDSNSLLSAFDVDVGMDGKACS